MNSGLTVSRRFRVQCERHGRKALQDGRRSQTPLAERIPRISRLMALAIQFDQLLCDGVVADQAELARLGHVTRARVTQIMNLLNLAPDVQEELLHLSARDDGWQFLSERQLRPIATALNWRMQRRVWLDLRSRRQLPNV